MASSFEDFLNSLTPGENAKDPKVGVEPSAEVRANASQVYGIFSSYVDVGFTRFEALQLIITHISAATPNNG